MLCCKECWVSFPSFKIRYKGFTLAEVLITLLIIAEVATFTIPKMITAQTNGASRSAAKEAATMVASAYNIYQQSNTVSSSTTLGVLTPYMNYVAVDTATALDDHVNANANYVCSGSYTCLRMHSGGTVMFLNNLSFGGTSTTNEIFFFL
jgi:prepilin-type N-terminal cleavage/methylation domain-containing protein